MATLDLDAARAARAEANGEAPTVTVAGETYTLPTEVYIETAEALRDGDVLAAVRVLLGDQWDAFREGASLQDCWAVVNGLGDLYAVDSPNSSASSDSSVKSGGRSRPTSRVSTKST